MQNAAPKNGAPLMNESFDFPKELRCDSALLKDTHPYTADMLGRAAFEIERLWRDRTRVIDVLQRVADLPYFKNDRVEQLVRDARDLLKEYDAGMPTNEDVRGILRHDDGRPTEMKAAE